MPCGVCVRPRSVCIVYFRVRVAERSCDSCERAFASVSVEPRMCARERGALVCVGRGCVGRNARTLLILLLAYFYYNVIYI